MSVLSRRQWWFVLIFTTLTCLQIAIAAGQNRLTEREIKAGFLYNFTKFVVWPPEVFENANAPFELGITGNNPFGNLLVDAASGKTVNGRAMRIKQFAENADLRECQILFVSSRDKKRTAQILQTLKGTSVLTVGEGPEFTQAGGMITFVIEGGKVRLVINLDAAAKGRIKISAQVIAVAHLMGGQATGKN